MLDMPEGVALAILRTSFLSNARGRYVTRAISTNVDVLEDCILRLFYGHTTWRNNELQDSGSNYCRIEYFSIRPQLRPPLPHPDAVPSLARPAPSSLHII